MTGMLASVNSVEEASIVLAEQVNIIDLKNPATGSLGRLDTDMVSQIVNFVDGRCLVSATIGDLPMQVQPVFEAATEVAATGVDFVKIGLMTEGPVLQIIQKLAILSLKTKLIAVLFADEQLDFQVVINLKNAGFAGVMLDTFDKTKGSLTEVMHYAAISDFVSHAKKQKMLCGLSGALRLPNIYSLLPLQPDYLGFRGALCVQQERTGVISANNVRQVKQAFLQGNT